MGRKNKSQASYFDGDFNEFLKESITSTYGINILEYSMIKIG